MEQLIINAISGAIGGGASGATVKQFDIGAVGNIIAGLVGGGVLGRIVTMIWPTLAPAIQSGGFDMGSIATQVASGGIGGIVLQLVVGFIKNSMMK
jgi:hypothetical protein